eukprot:TRINITY_DN5799_c0_g1_i2.p1 TRINITY_DN5799_c0_g1~~TRINITY_DN5799_c0_g1_i2.p1  ORF type:complete len:127 (-),score=16.04 TRINITY_DN5799_c0_g1_i2:147-527(-)
MIEICKKYSSSLELIHVYIMEAHPTDGWQLPDNEQDGVCYRQPQSLKERIQVCKQLVADFKLENETFVVDGIDNNTEATYEARPERIYVIEDSKIIFKSLLGPYGYDTKRFEAFIKTHPKVKLEQQ